MADDSAKTPRAAAASAVEAAKAETSDKDLPVNGDRRRTWQDMTNANGDQPKANVPAGLWLRCPACGAMSYRKQVEANQHVCPECDHHYRIGADERIKLLVDPGSFEPLWDNLGPKDTLQFTDRKSYKDRIAAEQKKTGHKDALVAGKAFIKGRGVVLAVMNPEFMMASMGSVVGEKITRAIELATELDRPVIVVCAGGGARMQEATLAVSQMIKTSAALARHDDAGGLYIALLTDPTTGGTAASFAMLGDLILAEPKALIGFTGARVIANTVRQELPEGFQRSEFLMEKGFVDRVVHRQDLRSEISRIIDYAGK
ncbi:MAG: acetyl-CoA carboxylase, carboxyltransferase subunit beta [Planctomycetota bacterium]